MDLSNLMYKGMEYMGQFSAGNYIEEMEITQVIPVSLSFLYGTSILSLLLMYFCD